MVDLIDALSHGPVFAHALIATYNFDAGFFESRVMERCRLINRCSTITVLTDREEYQRLCDLDGLEDINRTYLVQDVPARRRFHPKVILLASARAARLIVGSANVTQPGLTSNLELVTVIDFQIEKGDHLADVQAGYRFFECLADRLPGTTFQQNVRKLREDCPWLGETTSQPSVFVHNLDAGFLDQIEARLGGTTVDEYFTLSPYFDDDLHAVQLIAERFKPARITIVIKDQDTNLCKDALTEFQQAYPASQLQVMLLKPNEAESARRLHAKLHAFRHGKKALVMYGSANCTWPALIGNSHHGNVEAGILMDGVAFADVKSLFSSVGGLHQLAEGETFIAQINAAAPVAPPKLVRLIDVTRDDKRHLKITVEHLAGVHSLRLRIEFLEEDQTKSFLLSIGPLDGEQRVELSAEAIEVLDKFAVRACVVNETNNQLSGWRIVENLEEGGRPLRFQRAWEESARDANQFRRVMQDLCADNDNLQDLIEFLEVCNIRMDFPIRAREIRLREATAPVYYEQIDPESCKTVREAFAYFARRHLTKLENAVKAADRAQAPGVARVALTLAYAVESIWEWELSQLGRNQPEVSLDRWHDFRGAAGELIETYRSLVALMRKYVIRIEGLEKALKLSPAADEVSAQDLQQNAQRWVDRVDGELSRLLQYTRTRSSLGVSIALPMSNQDEIATESWKDIRVELFKGIAAWN